MNKQEKSVKETQREATITRFSKTRLAKLALDEIKKGYSVSLRVDLNATDAQTGIITGHPSLVVSSEFGAERIYTDSESSSKSKSSKGYSKLSFGYHFFRPTDDSRRFVLADLERDKTKKDRFFLCFMLESFHFESLSDEMIESLGLRGHVMNAYLFEDSEKGSKEFYKNQQKDEAFIDICRVGFYRNRYPYFQLSISSLFIEKQKKQVKSIDKISIPESHFFK